MLLLHLPDRSVIFLLVYADSVVGSAAGGQKVVMRRPAGDNRSPVAVKKFKADGEPML